MKKMKSRTRADSSIICGTSGSERSDESDDLTKIMAGTNLNSKSKVKKVKPGKKLLIRTIFVLFEQFRFKFKLILIFRKEETAKNELIVLAVIRV